MATGTGVLDVGRRDHIVLFYRDEQDLTERVSEYLLPAIQDGGVAIVVATPEHRRSFERYLSDAGVDVAAASGSCSACWRREGRRNGAHDVASVAARRVTLG